MKEENKRSTRAEKIGCPARQLSLAEIDVKEGASYSALKQFSSAKNRGAAPELWRTFLPVSSDDGCPPKQMIRTEGGKMA